MDCGEEANMTEEKLQQLQDVAQMMDQAETKLWNSMSRLQDLEATMAVLQEAQVLIAESAKRSVEKAKKSIKKGTDSSAHLKRYPASTSGKSHQVTATFMKAPEALEEILKEGQRDCKKLEKSARKCPVVSEEPYRIVGMPVKPVITETCIKQEKNEETEQMKNDVKMHSNTLSEVSVSGACDIKQERLIDTQKMQNHTAMNIINPIPKVPDPSALTKELERKSDTQQMKNQSSINIINSLPKVSSPSAHSNRDEKQSDADEMHHQIGAIVKNPLSKNNREMCSGSIFQSVAKASRFQHPTNTKKIHDLPIPNPEQQQNQNEVCRKSFSKRPLRFCETLVHSDVTGSQFREPNNNQKRYGLLPTPHFKQKQPQMLQCLTSFPKNTFNKFNTPSNQSAVKRNQFQPPINSQKRRGLLPTPNFEQKQSQIKVSSFPNNTNEFNMPSIQFAVERNQFQPPKNNKKAQGLLPTPGTDQKVHPRELILNPFPKDTINEFSGLPVQSSVKRKHFQSPYINQKPQGSGPIPLKMVRIVSPQIPLSLPMQQNWLPKHMNRMSAPHVMNRPPRASSLNQIPPLLSAAHVEKIRKSIAAFRSYRQSHTTNTKYYKENVPKNTKLQTLQSEDQILNDKTATTSTSDQNVPVKTKDTSGEQQGNTVSVHKCAEQTCTESIEICPVSSAEPSTVVHESLQQSASTTLNTLSSNSESKKEIHKASRPFEGFAKYLKQKAQMQMLSSKGQMQNDHIVTQLHQEESSSGMTMDVDENEDGQVSADTMKFIKSAGADTDQMNPVVKAE